jgi:PAS domain S-box-containing protein
MTESEKLELSLLDQVPVAIVITTIEGVIGYCNRGAEALLGWPRQDIASQPFEAIAASGSSCEALQEALESVASGGTWAGRVTLREPDGSGRAAEVRCSPLMSSDEKTIGLILVAHEAPHANAAGETEERARVGQRIARARKEAGLTQQELADRIGVGRRSVQGYESGQIAGYRHLNRIAAAVGRSRHWLVADDPAPEPSEMSTDLRVELRDLIRQELIATLSGAEAANGEPLSAASAG